MLRSMFRVIAIGVALLWVSPVVSATSPVEAYQEASKGHFYFFAEAPFDRFSCGLKIDALEALVSGLETQFAAAQIPVTITENREVFSVTFERATETTSFVEPSLSLRIDPTKELADPEMTKAGKAQVEAGYRAAVVGAIQIVRGIFDEYTLGRFQTYAEVAFKANKKGYDVAFKKEAATIQETFDGAIRRMSFSAQGQSISSKTTYINKAKEGRVLSSVELVPGPGMKVSIKVDYQRVQGLLLPKTLQVRSRQDVGGKPLENLVTVHLKGCKVTR